MCGRTDGTIVQVALRAIAAGVVGTPDKFAAWAMEESDRAEIAERERSRAMFEMMQPGNLRPIK